MGGRTPGINFWETTSSAAAVQEIQHRRNRCKCNAAPGNPTDHHTETQMEKGFNLRGVWHSQIQETTYQRKKKMPTTKPVSFLPRKRSKNVHHDKSTPLTQGGQAATPACSRLQYRRLLHRRMQEEHMKADLLPCSQSAISIQHQR